jgi:DNA-binding CsgD family transcriptional regulator
LAKLYQPLSELISEHVSALSVPESSSKAIVGEVLKNFGQDVLTKKEYQICQLLLQGHSAKAIANIMSIGYQTVKMHKKNIYSKTFLSSQAELLALFIDILQHEDLDPHLDHLNEHVKSA